MHLSYFWTKNACDTSNSSTQFLNVHTYTATVVQEELFRWMTWIKVCIASSSSCLKSSSHLCYPILYGLYFEFLFWPISCLISLKGRCLQPILQPNTRGQLGHFWHLLKSFFKACLSRKLCRHLASRYYQKFVGLVLMQKEWKMKERNGKKSMKRTGWYQSFSVVPV